MLALILDWLGPHRAYTIFCWPYVGPDPMEWLSLRMANTMMLALILDLLCLHMANTMLFCWPYVGPDLGLVGPSHGQHYVVLLALRWAFKWPTLYDYVYYSRANVIPPSKITWFQR